MFSKVSQHAIFSGESYDTSGKCPKTLHLNGVCRNKSHTVAYICRSPSGDPTGPTLRENCGVTGKPARNPRSKDLRLFQPFCQGSCPPDHDAAAARWSVCQAGIVVGMP
jgi:hypothetical protein